MKSVRIGKHIIGEGNPTFIVAEMGVNHNGELSNVYKLIDAAAEAGVDAIKFQKFTTEKLVTVSAPKANYQLSTTDEKESQFEMLKKLELSPEQLIKLKNYADSKGIMSFATPFDEESADFLMDIGVEAFKIGSGDLTNLPLLKRVAKKGLPVIISAGMSRMGEVEDALDAIYEEGNEQVILLHCTSNYPTSAKDSNLRVMSTLKQAFQIPTGYSDHTMGISVPTAAVALGAVMIEKHFTLDRGLEGPDHLASLEPDELREMVFSIRDVEVALGSPIKKPLEAELEVRSVAHKSIVAAVDIPAGSVITNEMLTVKRPGTGIPPKYMGWIVGRTAKQDISVDSLVSWEVL